MLKEYRPSEIKNIKVHGRTNGKMDPVTLFWTASGIELNIKASELRIRYKADYTGLEPWIDVIVNGVRYQKRPLEKGVHEISIWKSSEGAAGVEPPVRNIRIIRDTPAMPADPSTLLQIEAVFCDGTFEEIADPALRMEFIGDSITSGEGCIGPLEEQDWNSSCFDIVDNYCYMTARELNADYNVYSQSGWGFGRSWYGNPKENMPEYYEKVCGIVPGEQLKESGAGEEWDFDRFRPDIVVVNLGTNDIGSYTEMSHENARQMNFNNTNTLDSDGHVPEEDVISMKKEVISFIEKIRGKNPDAKIIWAYGMLGQDADYIDGQMKELLKSAVDEYVKNTGDKEAYYLQLPVTEADGFGSRSHPGHKSHQNASECLVKMIRGLGY